MSLFSRDPDVLKGPNWQLGQPEPDVEQALSGILFGDKVLRWTRLQTYPNFVTYIAQVRDADDGHGPDSFFVLTKIGRTVKLQFWFAVDALVFGKGTISHYPGLVTCTAGGVFPEHQWDGHEWQ